MAAFPQAAGPASVLLPGRLASGGRVPGTAVPPAAIPTTDSAGPGVYSKLGEVGTYAFTAPDLPRSRQRSPPPAGAAEPGQGEHDHGGRTTPAPPPAGPGRPRPGCGSIPGVSSEPSRCAPGLPAAHASTAATPAQALPPLCGFPHTASAPSPVHPPASHAVVATEISDYGQPPAGAPALYHGDHRCLPAGMGWSLPGQYGFWGLAPYGHARSHQFVGVPSCPLTPLLFAPATPAHSAHMHGQCHCGGLYKQAGGHSLHAVERPSGATVDVVQTGGFFTMASHIPGQDNLIADFLSRGRVLPSEWTLHPTVMDQMAREVCALEVDLFASALNARLPRYCSRVQDPAAWRIDAFPFPWKGFRGYAFLPISLIPHALRKTREDQAWGGAYSTAIRPRRNWFLDLIGLLAGSPRTLPLRPDLIVQPISQALHPRLSALHLTAWPLSGRPAHRRAFPTGLPPYSPAADVNPHVIHTIPAVRDFFQWCNSHGVDPRTASISLIADFLIALFNRVG